MPVDIPISIDRPKVNKIATVAYQSGKALYKTVAIQQNASLTFFQVKRTLDGIVFHDNPLVRFPAMTAFGKSHNTIRN